ncbi:MAG: alpha/beta fold hydrolase [Bacteroidia bacterium]
MRPESFTFRDGSTNQINHYTETASDRPLFLLLPAMGVRASYYPLFAERLVAAGVQVVSVDFRGLGESNVRASRQVDFGYETLIQDLKEVVDHLKKVYPQAPIYLLGHSLGGQIGLLYAARYPEGFDGVALVASCSVYAGSWQGFGKLRILFASRFFSLMSQILGFHHGKYLGFGGREARTVMRDWGFNAIDGRYQPKGSDFDYEAALGERLIPVLAINIEGDDFAPIKATQHLLNKLSSQAPKQYHLYTKEVAGHKLNHFNWVKYSEGLVPILQKWLRASADL